jgi:hypothetical protein
LRNIDPQSPAVNPAGRDQRAAGCLNPLAQSGETVADTSESTPAVVVDRDPVRADRDRASAGPGVPHDVGHAFPDHPTEQLVLARVDDIDSTWQFGVHSGRAQHLTSARQLADQRDVSISGYRSADIRERASAELLHLGHLPGRAFWIEFRQAFGETSFDCDRRERMAEQVVQVRALVFRRAEPPQPAPRRAVRLIE